MKWSGGNQSLVDLDSTTTHSDPGPLYTFVAGFPRYVDRADSLPLLEQIKLRLLTDFIVSSFDPGSLPVTGIHIIGHADSDAQRGKAFEQQISEARARNVQAYLKREVDRNARINLFQMLPGTPTTASIDWRTPKGVGASEPDPENLRWKKTPGKMTEEDRKRNRRVEFILEPGSAPIPEVVSQDPTVPWPGGQGQMPGIPGIPSVPQPLPAPSKEWLKEALKRDPIVRSLPPFLRDKVIDGLEDGDEMVAEKIVDALPLDPKLKAAVQASVKSVLQMLKGKKFQPPTPPPPQFQQPPSTAPDVPKAPGETILKLPPFKF
ncbi:MAG: hypothetical protein WKF37_24160 [Bryobacteraceae bacterium]